MCNCNYKGCFKIWLIACVLMYIKTNHLITVCTTCVLVCVCAHVGVRCMQECMSACACVFSKFPTKDYIVAGKLFMHASVHVCMCARVYVCACVHVCFVCMYMCVCVCE